MTKYNFDQYIDRKHTASMKWGLTKSLFGSVDVLPMWVADMDFEAPPEVIEAIRQRADHGIFGYSYVPSSAGEAFKEWLEKRHGWVIEPEWILYTPGVVPAIGMAIQALTEPGDKVLVQPPVYTPFFNMIRNNNRVIVHSPLEIKDNRFHINMDDFEAKLREGVKLFLLCNPHNPGGRVWTEEELRQMAELCLKYDVIIVSDEIHSDLVFKPHKHVPVASLSGDIAEKTVTFMAPSKTFNLAGLQASTVIIKNERMRRAFRTVQTRLGITSLNPFAAIGLETAYRHGEEWLEELLDYLYENIMTAKDFIDREIPGISVMIPDATYLIWLDCRKLGLSDREIWDALTKKGKLGLEPGPKYGPGGEGFLRMNVGCSRKILMEGLNRLKKAFSS